MLTLHDGRVQSQPMNHIDADTRASANSSQASNADKHVDTRQENTRPGARALLALPGNRPAATHPGRGAHATGKGCTDY